MGGICFSLPAPEPSAKPHHVVVVGAGFGGNGVLHGLTEANGWPEGLSVTLLDRATKLSIGATWQFVWSKRRKEIAEYDLRKLQVNPHVTLLTGAAEATVESLDTARQTVTLTNGKSISYDSLVLSPGVVSKPSLVAGLADSPALDICNRQHVPLIEERLATVLEQAKQTPQTILVCVTRMPYKCPPVPLEVCSLLDDLRREHGVLDNVRIILSVPVAFPFGGPPVAKFFKASLAEQGIAYWPHHAVTKIETTPQGGSIVHFDLSDGDGGASSSKATPVDLLLCTFPQVAPDFCQPLCNPKGYMVVDLQTNAVTSLPSDSGVYAIGDACHTTFPKPNKPHPKAGEFAYMMGVHVGHQIAAAHAGAEAPPPPARQASCVAECGVGGKGVNIMPNFTAVLADPANGMPKFAFPPVTDASLAKKVWINGYLTKFFGQGNYEPFTSS